MLFLSISPPACVVSSVSTWVSVRRPESCSSASAGGHEDSRTASVCAGPSLLTWPARTNNSYGFIMLFGHDILSYLKYYENTITVTWYHNNMFLIVQGVNVTYHYKSYSYLLDPHSISLQEKVSELDIFLCDISWTPISGNRYKNQYESINNII